MCQNVCQNKQQQGGRLVDKLRGPRGEAARSRVTGYGSHDIQGEGGTTGAPCLCFPKEIK